MSNEGIAFHPIVMIYLGDMCSYLNTMVKE